jgi:putative tryptophan/tyrosine transport system substrate-binding protein
MAIGRRQLISAIAGAAVAWPLAARAQATMPVIGFLDPGSSETSARKLAGFLKGLNSTGYIDGKNVSIDYHWLEGRYDRVPGVLADLVRKRVAVIAIPGFQVAALAAKAATTTIPIVFGAAEDPVELGLVANLAHPGGNTTGTNSFVQEIGAKRLRLLHELVPKAVRVAVLVNPSNASATEITLHDMQVAAPLIGVQTQTLRASTIGEINAAFAVLARDRPDALFVAPDGFLNSRGVQLAILAARERIPSSYTNRETVAAGGLMSYGTDLAEVFREVGVYAGRILKGEMPADLPVLQETKFEFVINLQTARALNIDVPPAVLSIADEVIE